MNRIKKILKGFVIGILILVGIVLCILTTVDRTPYKQMSYYESMNAALDSFHVNQQEKIGDTLQAGWFKVALTPDMLPYPLAGYGLREKAIRVGDTTFVRTFVFDNKKTRVSYVCLDLLIFPPSLKDRVREALEKKYHTDIYLTATHTHSAPGGWEPKIAGKFLAGNYSQAYVDLLYNAIDVSIDGAIKKLAIVQQSYIRVAAPTAVHNRLKGVDGPKDPYIRGLKFKTQKGEEACLFTFAAHANCLDSDIIYISADYPGKVSSMLEKNGWASFVSYAAGAVGSHGPGFPLIPSAEKQLDTISNILVAKLMNAPIHYTYTSTLYYKRLPLSLREPHLRIEKDIRIRPWVFHTLFGSDQPDIQIVEIGNTVLLGMPCDYSGELMPPLEKVCSDNNAQLILSGFNGGYIGYITDDACYDWDRGETMDMNWHGPYNAAYLTEVNERILKKVVSGQ
jgi:neutral ceramidase